MVALKIPKNGHNIKVTFLVPPPPLYPLVVVVVGWEGVGVVGGLINTIIVILAQLGIKNMVS